MTDAISEFWHVFQRRAQDLSAAKSADSPVYDALLQRLQAIDSGLYLEFSVHPGAKELIITADGKRSLFRVARAIVEAAPSVEGWTIRALKPKLGFPKKVRWNNIELRVADIMFDPLAQEGSENLGIRILIPDIMESETEDAHNAILRAIDHGLGEEEFAESVQYTEVCPLPAGAEPDEFIPLTQLEAFIRWRESKRREASG